MIITSTLGKDSRRIHLRRTPEAHAHRARVLCLDQPASLLYSDWHALLDMHL